MVPPHVVGIAECKVCSDPSGTLLTFGLGSCVALALYDSRKKIGGLLHVLLPESKFGSSSREFNPHMFADTGFSSLLKALLTEGARREDLVAKLAGGANMLRASSLLDIGRRNSEVILHLLSENKIPVHGKSLGGTVGRSVELRLEDGAFRVRSLGRGEEVL